MNKYIFTPITISHLVEKGRAESRQSKIWLIVACRSLVWMSRTETHYLNYGETHSLFVCFQTKSIGILLHCDSSSVHCSQSVVEWCLGYLYLCACAGTHASVLQHMCLMKCQM